jgi:hypothetical protein
VNLVSSPSWLNVMAHDDVRTCERAQTRARVTVCSGFVALQKRHFSAENCAM